MTEDTTKPTLDEKYTAARNSRDLTVGPSELPNRDSDVLAAAAWTQSRVGHALMQLHSEWDAAEKPAKPTPTQIKSLVGTFQQLPHGVAPELQPKDAKGNPAPLTFAVAKAYADAWYRHEVGLLLGKLKTLPGVREALRLEVASWTRGDTWGDPSASADVLRWWLDQTCHACGGTKWEIAQGTNRQSSKACRVCHGSGVTHAPHGQHGKKLANWMDEGVNIARRRIRKALQNYRKHD